MVTCDLFLRVLQYSCRNMMSADNLAIIFSPTLLQSPHTDPVKAIASGMLEQRAIVKLIENYPIIFDH